MSFEFLILTEYLYFLLAVRLVLVKSCCIKHRNRFSSFMAYFFMFDNSTVGNTTRHAL